MVVQSAARTRRPTPTGAPCPPSHRWGSGDAVPRLRAQLRDWGYVLAQAGPAPTLALSPSAPPRRFLDDATLAAAAVFPLDRPRRDLEPSTLDRPRIVDDMRRGFERLERRLGRGTAGLIEIPSCLLRPAELPGHRPRDGTRPRYLADRALGDPRRLHPVAGFGARGNGFGEAHLRGQPTLRCHATPDPGGARPLRWACSPSAAAGARVGWADGSDGRGDVDGPRRHITRRHGAHDGPAPRRRRSGIRTGAPAVAVRAGSECPRRDGLARATSNPSRRTPSDATVGALFWGAVAGCPSARVRASNTLDAMIGYRNDRYGRFGWAAARWDDVVNLAPARLAGALTSPRPPSSVARRAPRCRRGAGMRPRIRAQRGSGGGVGGRCARRATGRPNRVRARRGDAAHARLGSGTGDRGPRAGRASVVGGPGGGRTRCCTDVLVSGRMSERRQR